MTAAYELLTRSSEYEVIVLEESDCIGGISKTVNYKGNRMDMGGHRFFSKVPEVNAWWNKMMPAQGALPYDDLVLNRTSSLSPEGPDPEKDDCVMLKRNRISRILFNNRFFDYPISLKADTIKNMGLATTFVVGCSYLKAAMFHREEKSLEDFYINRFGKKLYSMFFERYTENLWGIHPRNISPEWGAQRVKGLSIAAVLKDIFSKKFFRENRTVETSLIEEFAYPKYGPGQLWELTALEIEKKGGKILKNCRVEKLIRNSGRELSAVAYKDASGDTILLEGDYVVSSMPIKDLVAGMDNVPPQISEIAEGLLYRDYMTAGILVSKLKLKNKTSIPTIGDIVPDNWIYIHEKSVRMGRLQVYNNWSPYMVKDIDHSVWIGLEYFCNEGDSLWNLADEAFIQLGIDEMLTLGLIESKDDVLDAHAERVKKAYPAYFGTYDRIDTLREYLDTIPNLFCVGRNGQHRYNNIDHSMCTSFEAVKNILNGSIDKSNIWQVNTEQAYHESKS